MPDPTPTPQPSPDPPLTGWPAVVKLALGLTSDRVVTWALVIALLYIGPKMLTDINASNQRVIQEQGELNRQQLAERDGKQRQIDELRDKQFIEGMKQESERNRRANETQTRQLLEATLKLSSDIGRLDATNQRLEKSIDALTRKMNETSSDAPVRLRLKPTDPGGFDRAIPDPYLPIDRCRPTDAVADDHRHGAGDHDRMQVIRGRMNAREPDQSRRIGLRIVQQ